MPATATVVRPSTVGEREASRAAAATSPPVITPCCRRLSFVLQEEALTLSISDPNEEVGHEHTDQYARHRRLDQSCAVFAPRLHDGVRRLGGGLYARGRPGARRRDQDRHQWHHRGRCQGRGRGRPDAGLFRAPDGRRQSAGDPGLPGDFRPARIHQGRDPKARQARRLRGRPGLLFPQGRSHQDHRHAAAVPDRQRQDRHRAVRRSRRHGGVGEVAGRQHR